MNPIGRYGGLWSRPGPPGLFTPGMFRRGAPLPLQVHRRIFTGYPSGRLAPAVWPASVWRSGRWLSERSKSTPDRGLQERFESLTGVPIDRQDSRLAALSAIGIGSSAAYRFGLILDGAKDRWMEYVYDHEAGWNIAAGGLATAPSVAMLSDKWATAERLQTAGVPMVNSRRIPAGTEITEAVLHDWLDGRHEVYLKPNTGGRGEGAFVLTGPIPTVTPYQSGQPVPDPVEYVRESVAGRDYLCQPVLRSSPLFAAADPIDVVTIRVVTRDVGEGPRLFSAVIEAPLPPQTERQTYVNLVVEPDGRLGRRPHPPWFAGPEPGSDAAQLFDALHGLVLPDHEVITTEALAAHRQFPGVFAVAWDVAITGEGPVFLEGNAGFGTSVPQMAAGGLLVGLEKLR